MDDGWSEVLAALGGVRGELRFSLSGGAAVRVFGGPVARRHAEPPDVAAPWTARADCGAAAGWLLAEAPPADEAAAVAALGHAVDGHTARLLQSVARRRGEIVGDLLERLVHRLRTDVSSLQIVADGALAGGFDGDEREPVRSELRGVAEAAQRRLGAMSAVREAMDPATARVPEALAGVLEDAGVAVSVRGAAGERAVTALRGSGWSTCARLLAAALSGDGPLAGGAVVVEPDALGWAVTAGAPDGAGAPCRWTEGALGELAYAGGIAVAAGGDASAERVGDERLRVRLVVPAAPSE
jgi:hypothetical protein